MRIKIGDKVALHYTGRTQDGRVFSTSTEGAPLVFVVGSGDVMAGLDAAVLGMSVGQSKHVLVPPELAHGLHRAERVLTSSGQPAGETIKKQVLFRVTARSDASETRDYNHPLAGQALTFDLELVDVDPGPDPAA